MSEWVRGRLGDRVQLVTGFAFKSAEFTNAGVRLARGDNVKRGHFEWGDKARYWPSVKPELANFKLQIDDVLIGMDGSRVGENWARVREEDLPCLLVQRVARLRALEGLEQKFLWHLIANRRFVTHVKSLQTGSAIPHISGGQIKSFSVVYPPLIEQRRIAGVLDTFNDKIELNRRINETLQALAQTIFENWLSSNSDLPRQTVDQLIKAGLLAIGDGYRAKNDELFSPGLPFIRAGELNNGFDTSGADILNASAVAAAGEKRSRPDDVAFTSKGTIGRFARVTPATPEFVYSPQVCFWRSLAPERLRPAILYIWMVSNDLKSQIDAVSGQTDMAPYVSLKDQRMMTMPNFPDDQHRVADLLDTLLDLQATNAAESKNLSATRDLLLPKLMSGEIRIRDAEAMIADAA